MVSVPTTKGGKEERPWERGCGVCSQVILRQPVTPRITICVAIFTTSPVWFFAFFWVTFALVQRNRLQDAIVVVDVDRSTALTPQPFITAIASIADV